jgi:CrcB protein
VVLAAVGASGAAGATTRFALHRMTVGRAASRLHWTTFAINVAGTAILGVIAGIAGRAGGVLAAAIGTGFCGGLTTYSTFLLEVLALERRKQVGAARGYLVASIVAGLVAAGLGIAMGSALAREVRPMRGLR